MKYNLKKLLQKCLKKKVEYVLLKEGFNNNCDLDSLEINLLQDLTIELNTSDLVITFDDVAVTPYITSYNGGDTLVGLKFNKLERW